MSIAGELSIQARLEGSTVRGIDIASSRPQAASLLVGRSHAEAVRLAPLLFSICRQAQQVAAVAAGEAANGTQPQVDLVARRRRRILLEALQEHLWRLLLDWPSMFGLPTTRESFAHWHRRTQLAAAQADAAECRLLGADLVEFCDHELLPYPLAQWQSLSDVQAVPASSSGLLSPLLGALFESDAPVEACNAPTFLSDISARELAIVLPRDRLDDFSHTPTLGGVPCETGALAQMQSSSLVASLLASGRRLVARVVARIGAMLKCADRLMVDEDSPIPTVDVHQSEVGTGIARVKTARGLLVHRTELVDDCVKCYTIVAPTEWNFHPAGTLVREWTGRQFRDETQLIHMLRAWVLALDPCVAYRVGVSHA